MVWHLLNHHRTSRGSKAHPLRDTGNKSHEQQANPAPPPIIVNVIPSPKTESERADEEKERRQKAETDAKLTEYTGELAFFTKGLFIATVVLAIATFGLLIAAFRQSRDMKASIAVADKTALAALKSADTAEKDLIASHKPLLTISDLALLEQSEFEERAHISFGLRNSGKGLSIVNKIGVTIRTLQRSADGQEWRPQTGFQATDWSGAIETGDVSGGHRVVSDLITGKFQDIREGTIQLFVNFEILSKDIFKNPIRQTFPFVYNTRGWRFERAPAQWIEQSKPESE